VTILNVRHTTVYRYSRPVRLGDHRLMLRPRDSHDLRLIQTSLKFSPAASVRWMHDVFGNSVAIASFAEPAAELRIESNLQLETFVVDRPTCLITPDAVSYPFIYSADDRIDLGRLTERHHPDPADRLGAWARGFVRSNPTDTSALLAGESPATPASAARSAKYRTLNPASGSRSAGRSSEPGSKGRLLMAVSAPMRPLFSSRYSAKCGHTLPILKV